MYRSYLSSTLNTIQNLCVTPNQDPILGKLIYCVLHIKQFSRPLCVMLWHKKNNYYNYKQLKVHVIWGTSWIIKNYRYSIIIKLIWGESEFFDKPLILPDI